MPIVDFVVSISGISELRLAVMIISKLKGSFIILETNPKVNKLKLICVIALIFLILNFSFKSLGEEIKSSSIKYPVEELQQKAIQNSELIKLLDQAIKVAESKKWTSLAPNLGMGNNFASKNSDFRFNINWDLMEVLGGGRIRQGNLEIAKLKLQKYELENKLKIEILEYVLALQQAERRLISDNAKIDMLKKRLLLIEAEYRRGKGELDSLTKYWEIEMKLRDDKASAEDEITLQKAKLEQLVGAI